MSCRYEFRRLALIIATGVLLVASVSTAQLSFGGYTFPNTAAFADHAEAVGSSLILPTVGSTVQSALTDINLGTWVVAKNTIDFVDVFFTNNVIINEAGADFVVFEYATPEPYKIAISTNGTPGGLGAFRQYSGTAAIDLSDFGLALGATVSMLRIQPNVYGGTAELSADIQDIGALHSGDVPSINDAFTFDDGTVQGWTINGAYDETGNTLYNHSFQFGWKDAVNFPTPPGHDPLGDQKGSLQLFTFGGHGINNPTHTWWIMQFHSPDLSASPAWQSAKGYTVEIAECMASFGTLSANLFVRVYDQDQARDRYFYSGEAQEMIHDIYGDGMADWNHFSFDWSGIASFPTRYTIKEIFINIFGRLNTYLEGGVYLDQVVPILGAMPQTPAPPSELQAVLLIDQIHITWKDNSIDESGFILEMKESPGGIGDWQILDTLAANVISYQMDNPVYQHTYEFRVKAFNQHGCSAYSNSDTINVFYLLSWIKIESPNGGELWAPGSTQMVKWSSGPIGKPANVIIEYSTDNGSHWMPDYIASVANTGSYLWTIPNTPSNQCILKIKDAMDGMPYDLSNKPFTITSPNQPILSVSPLVLNFGVMDDSLTFSIRNLGGGLLNWNVAANPAKAWLTFIHPTSGSGDQTIRVKVRRSLLVADRDSTQLIVSSNVGGQVVWVKIERTAGTLPPHWHFTANTGQNAIVVIPTTANPNIEGFPLANQDIIGAFTPAGLCCGWKQWQGQNLSLTVWGDDDQTPAVDGFRAGETISYRVYRLSSAKEWTNVQVAYNQGNGKYNANAFMILSQFNVRELRTFTLNFNRGWNLFSINVDPITKAMDQMMAPLGNKLVLVKNGAGHAYIPAYAINDIGVFDFREGYQAYLSEQSSLDVPGQPVDPSYPILMLAGWNMKSYLPMLPISPIVALASIRQNLILVKNGAGQSYIPQYDINDIGSMQEGQGYQFYLSKNDTLIYPASVSSLTIQAGPPLKPLNHTQHFHFTANTGENAIVVVPLSAHPRYADGRALEVGDEIGVFDKDQRCCGAAVWQNANLAITIWGDDAMTDSIDGFTVGDSLRFRVWHKTSKLEFKARVTFLEGQSGLYAANGFYVLQELTADQVTRVSDARDVTHPTAFAIIGAHPNPFNMHTSIQFTLPADGIVSITIFDCRGETVFREPEMSLPAGQHVWRWNGVNAKQQAAASGLYFYQIKFRNTTGSEERRMGKVVMMR